MRELFGFVVLAWIAQWAVRWSVRAELERMGFKPLPPRELTETEWDQVNELERAGKLSKANSLYQKLSRAVRA